MVCCRKRSCTRSRWFSRLKGAACTRSSVCGGIENRNLAPIDVDRAVAELYFWAEATILAIRTTPSQGGASHALLGVLGAELALLAAPLSAPVLQPGWRRIFRA